MLLWTWSSPWKKSCHVLLSLLSVEMTPQPSRNITAQWKYHSSVEISQPRHLSENYGQHSRVLPAWFVKKRKDTCAPKKGEIYCLKCSKKRREGSLCNYHFTCLPNIIVARPNVKVDGHRWSAGKHHLFSTLSALSQLWYGEEFCSPFHTSFHRTQSSMYLYMPPTVLIFIRQKN